MATTHQSPSKTPQPPSNSSSPTPPLRSRPSVLSFTSLAPSDSRSNSLPTVFSKRRTDGTTPYPRHLHRASFRSPAAQVLPRTPSTITHEPSRLLGARPEELDLLSIDHPDELFQAFTVREVRLLAHRSRLDAAKKQEDLRQMVGERYRDLLGAADSIVRMKTSSMGLLEMLCGSIELCNKSELKRKAAEAGNSYSSSLASSSRITYTLATLVKLLLELSENIWRALERDDFLSAARLEALGRIISSELTSGRWDETGSTEPGAVSETFPIVDRQAEALAQLGPQIALRARAFLRRWDVGRNETAAALASILLLDNTSLLETASLLLQARRTSLDILLGSKDPGPWMERVRKAIKLVSGTVEQTLAIFGAHPAYFVNLLRAIQQPASASLQQQFLCEPDSSKIELEPIISMLPNAHQSMRYLPASVTSFAPFIPIALDGPVVGTENPMPDFLAQWAHASRTELMRTVRSHLSAVHATAELVDFRAIVASTTSDEALESEITAELWARFDALYQTRLAETKVSTLKAVAQLEPTLGDAVRREWVFADRLPKVERTAAFERLLGSLKARTEGRWGTGESEIVSRLEHLGEGLRADFENWCGSEGGGSEEKYVGFGRAFLDSLADGLEDLLESEGVRGDVAKEVMVGDVALQIASTERSFITNLGLGQAVLVERLRTRLSQIASRSLEGWTALTANAGLEIYRPVPLYPREGQAQDWPSEPLYAALEFLAQALAGLGPHRLEAERERGLAHKLMSAFIGGLPAEAHTNAFDAELLRQLSGMDHATHQSTTESVCTFLARVRTLWFPLLSSQLACLHPGTRSEAAKRVVVGCVRPGPRFALLAL
ncbi:hypothetical protein CROQUDRAFT_654077 [Cronartium quercuum f. sp. fusiforme G11]|uniref:Conserved oligomeric Golgi complex subunit 1 n=1 Tax=Cronartium quercuum f. sp. fusiforme G11 TaxID=708437 RepID=A0A9P6TE44_9BASI|nr:hypothetical protein CROQUDRAFT_654077 [Cronartium quercuum f. sp. fusiforme G11]